MTTKKPRDGLFRAVIYLRVSSQGQVKTDYDPEGISIPAQRKACIQRAKELGAVVVDEYVEPARSAKELDRRDVFQRMRRRILKDKDIDYVIVHAFHRSFRNAADRAIVTREFRKAGTRIVATTLKLDDSDESEMVEGILSYVDEYRIKADGRDIAYKMGEKAKLGGTISTAKIGYKNIRIKTEDGRNIADVELDPEREPYMRQMFELYATGKYDYYDLQEIMTERGLRTRPTSRNPIPGKVSIHSIGNILRDRYYCGYVTYDGVEYKGRHQPLISEDLFNKVQRVLHAKGGGDTRRRVHKHHLKGQLWCDRCRKRLLLAKANGNGGIYFYYFCIGRQQKTCDLPYLPITGPNGLEHAIAQHYNTVTIDTRFQADLTARVDACLADEHASNTQLRRDLTRRLRELDTQETALVAYIGNPDWPQTKLNNRMREIRQEQEGINRQLDDIHTALDASRELFTLGLDLLRHPRDLYRNGDDTVKTILTQAIFTRLYLDIDDDHRVTVSSHQLAEPFDALTHAHTAWRHPHTRRERKPQVAPPDRDNTQDHKAKALLASIFADRGSSKASWVGLTHQHKNREVLVEGPEITIRPVGTRRVGGDVR